MASVSLDQIYEVVLQLKSELEAQLAQRRVGASQIQVSEGLSDISDRLGLIQSGEFRVGNGAGIGKGFSGVRMGFPPFEYGGEFWHLVGILNDILQFGLSAETGKAYFGGGSDVIDQYGIHVYDANGKPAFIALSQAETINSEALGAGDVLIGDNTSGTANLLWDQSAAQLKFRIGTVLSSYLATAGLTQVAAKSNLPTASKQTLSNGVLTALSFTLEEYDDGGFVDIAGNPTRITIPTGQGGVYSIGANVGFDGNATGIRFAGIYITGAVNPFTASQVPPPAAATTTLNFTEDQALVAGDYVELKLSQNSGGNLGAWGNLYVRKIR